MATPETRTGQVEAAEHGQVSERKSDLRFPKVGWWARRFKEMSWAGRFNLIIVLLAGLNVAAILIADALDWHSVVLVCAVIYAVVLLTWFVGFVVLMLLTIKRFFTPSRTQPPTDYGDGTGYNKV